MDEGGERADYNAKEFCPEDGDWNSRIWLVNFEKGMWRDFNQRSRPSQSFPARPALRLRKVEVLAVGAADGCRFQCLSARKDWSGRADLNCASLLRSGPLAVFFQCSRLRGCKKLGCSRSASKIDDWGNVFRRGKLVGTGRFELPTPRTPSECSTRLSHVPTSETSGPSGPEGL